MTTELAKQTNFDQINHPGRPVHVHQCAGLGDGKTGHAYVCDSPYCEVMQEDCPIHGGPTKIRIGREPWRGR
jgi:hypothetical protein